VCPESNLWRDSLPPTFILLSGYTSRSLLSASLLSLHLSLQVVSSTKSLGGRELRIVESIDAYRIANQCVHSTPIPTPHLASKPASSGFPSAYAASGKSFNPYFTAESVLNYEVNGLDVCTLSCLDANASQYFL
jgi:hypothetical protein